MIKPLASIIVCTYNDANFLSACISSILNQTIRKFELIIVDDGSTDDTPNIVKAFKDKRIKYFRLPTNSGSIGKIRNYSVTLARGKYILTTDSDCVVPINWVEKILKKFSKYDCAAIEGKIIYFKENYSSSLSDREISNSNGGRWMTANMAYKKEVFNNMNFRPDYIRLEDRELALRIKKANQSIIFCPDCLIFHQRKVRTIKSFLNEAKNCEYRVRLFKELNDNSGNLFHIIEPAYLLIALFPPLIFIELIRGKIKNMNDLILLPFLWIKSIYMRYIIWKTAFKERIFVI